MGFKELVQWLRANSSGIYRPANEAAELLLAQQIEIEGWRQRFPQYEYRRQDDCVTLKL